VDVSSTGTDRRVLLTFSMNEAELGGDNVRRLSECCQTLKAPA